jgi:ketosteroid isomerase-like protein
MTAASPQACMTEFTAALIRRDLGAALALLTDDVVLFYSNGTAILGKTAFADTMEASWQVVTDYRYETLETNWLARSDAVAGVIYAFAWSGVARGQPVSGAGRGTRLFRRDGGGALFGRHRGGWRIAHEHLSAGQWGPEQT